MSIEVISEAKLAATGLWKLYGSDPNRFLADHLGQPDHATVVEAGYIPAVYNVDLEVRAGEILMVMGLSGSGKSTLVRCLSRLIEPTAGSILLDGEDLLAMSTKELIQVRRHKMGMVFQHFALLPHRTVVENVAFPLEVQGVDRATRLAQAEEILDLVGLGGRGGYYPRELSGGQQQRVGIGRSLAVEPEVWFLDEPFSALDPLIRREMQDEFLRLQSELRKTIVFITHDFDEAIRLADRIAIMYEGRIVQVGTPEELVTAPATDYVAAFTKDVQRDKIVTVAAVMDSIDEVEVDGTGAHAVIDARSVVGDVAAQVLAANEPVGVVDDDGNVVGSLGRDRLIDTLYGSG